MEEKFGNLVHEWQNYFVAWTRDRAPKLIVILLLAFVFIRVLGAITRRVVAFAERRAPDGLERAQQVRTVAEVIRSGGVFLIVFFTLMAALKDGFNINIEPLLASAGIAGLAIGFGAQTLVKDVINGFFILVENQFQVGDIVRISGVSGKVEEITMRRTVLRDNDGTMHVVPNGAIQMVSNMARDWSQVTLQVSVDYSESTDRVIKLLQDVAQALYNDPVFKADMVAEPVVPGIDRVHGHEVDYLLLAKVRPGRQHDVARELRRRIKTCFEENKIKAGVPLRVYVGEPPAINA